MAMCAVEYTKIFECINKILRMKLGEQKKKNILKTNSLPMSFWGVVGQYDEASRFRY